MLKSTCTSWLAINKYKHLVSENHQDPRHLQQALDAWMACNPMHMQKQHWQQTIQGGRLSIPQTALQAEHSWFCARGYLLSLHQGYFCVDKRRDCLGHFTIRDVSSRTHRWSVCTNLQWLDLLMVYQCWSSDGQPKVANHLEPDKSRLLHHPNQYCCP